MADKGTVSVETGFEIPKTGNNSGNSTEVAAFTFDFGNPYSLRNPSLRGPGKPIALA
jgi:hypothetical protein